jgi:hypothetical protein
MLEDFLFFSLYSFSCLAIDSTTLEKPFEFLPCLVLSCFLPTLTSRIKIITEHNIPVTYDLSRPLH